MRKRVCGAAMALAICALAACSSTSGQIDRRGPVWSHVAALAACDGKIPGDMCKMTVGNGSMEGVCEVPEGDADKAMLACRLAAPPQGRPPEGTMAPSPQEGAPGGMPPEEVFTACDGKKAGDACSVKMGDRALDGTCAVPPESAQDSRLSCRPSSQPGPPPGGGQPAPQESKTDKAQ
jgi:hypothetical protein